MYYPGIVEFIVCQQALVTEDTLLTAWSSSIGWAAQLKKRSYASLLCLCMEILIKSNLSNDMQLQGHISVVKLTVLTVSLYDWLVCTYNWVWCVVCGVWCGVWCVVCGVWCVVHGVVHVWGECSVSDIYIYVCVCVCVCARVFVCVRVMCVWDVCVWGVCTVGVGEVWWGGEGWVLTMYIACGNYCFTKCTWKVLGKVFLLLPGE